ncbi:hypothetical protein [Paenibacillus agricola]|uniref:DUF4013 domain-containing protein n=1 Tax=Paenibacillus agricola TaxID=2716264 RepID=A0ABX0J8R9_9BACL|nr:hypothetical protein [Paenibacillus agricola]NHN31998.1 hypothetical protein [Paenibacillus agricola]
MGKLLKNGLLQAWSQPFAVCLLFIYNLLWGVLLYALIRSIVVPLLHRYPSPELPREAVHLFWLEGQFQLMKTDLMYPYLWWGLALLLVRLLFTPLLSAGLYYSLEHLELNAGYRFMQGIRKLALPFILLYAIQIVLVIVPFYLLGPKLMEAYSTQHSLAAITWYMAPWILGYLAYLFLLNTVFMYMQFGLAGGKSPTWSLGLLIRNLAPVMLLALITLVVTVTITALVMASAMVWAGFAALLVVQAYRLVQVFGKIWMITSQHTLWNAKNE